MVFFPNLANTVAEVGKAKPYGRGREAPQPRDPAPSLAPPPRSPEAGRALIGRGAELARAPPRPAAAPRARPAPAAARVRGRGGHARRGWPAVRALEAAGGPGLRFSEICSLYINRTRIRGRVPAFPFRRLPQGMFFLPWTHSRASRGAQHQSAGRGRRPESCACGLRRPTSCSAGEPPRPGPGATAALGTAASAPSSLARPFPPLRQMPRYLEYRLSQWDPRVCSCPDRAIRWPAGGAVE